MDWQSILTIVGIVAFVFLMMRGCGGMMSGGGSGGGCGMGTRRPRQNMEGPDAEHDREPVKTKR